MVCHSVDKHLGVETVVAHFFEYYQRLFHITGKKCFYQPEIIIVVEDIEVVDSGLVGDVAQR